MLKNVLLGAVALSMAALVACSLKLRGETPAGKVELDIDVDRRTAVLSPDDANPPGTCVKLTWLDGNGNPIGSAEVTAGGPPVDVPPGTEDVSVGPCDPPQDPKKKKKRRAGSPSLVAQQVEVFPYRQIPIEFSDSRGRWVEFTVEAPNREQADEIAQEFRSGMFQEPCPPQVTPYAIADVERLSDGSVRYSILSTASPVSLDFRWNGEPLFTLADASVAVANGWYATTVHVPADLVETPFPGSPAENEASFTLQTSQQTLSLANSFVVEL